jgi:hypothetical protein
MVKTLNIQTQILSDRTLQITIPDDVPLGLAEVIVVIVPTQKRVPEPSATAGDLVESPLFGLWADRDNIGDSLAYASQLRSQAERRADA